ncbi:hypothetical protein HK100_011003, partial [Physocladia obscura]
MENLSELRRAVKEEYGDAMPVSVAFIQLWTGGTQITDLDDLDGISDRYFKKGKRGLFVDIHTTPSSVREPSSISLVADSIQPAAKKQRIDARLLPELSTKFKTFEENAQIVDGSIVSSNQTLLPHPQDALQKLFVRKCYQDVYRLMEPLIRARVRNFAISGTPG